MTMGRLALVVVSLALIAWVVPRVDATDKDQTRGLVSVLNVSDRQTKKMDDWYQTFKTLWNAHKQRIEKDPDILCKTDPKHGWQFVIGKLKEAQDKINTVQDGLTAMKKQLTKIRKILEDADLGGTSGLHCDTDPDSKICLALKALDDKAAAKQLILDSEKQMVADAITNAEQYDCNCKWEAWTGDFGECTPECGDGTKTETREKIWPNRNKGTVCNPLDATKTVSCTNGCCPVDCEWNKWQEWDDCPPECKAKNSRKRIRTIMTASSCQEGGAEVCDNADANGEEKCNYLTVLNNQIKNKKARIEELKNLIKLYKKHLCDPNPCMNMGTCNEGTCTCAEGWTGPHCKEKKEAEKKARLTENQIAEVYYNGKWMPLCGHFFWDNNTGATLFCREMTGSQSASGRITAKHIKMTADAYVAGTCFSSNKRNGLFSCSYTHGRRLKSEGLCKNGDRYGVKISCE